MMHIGLNGFPYPTEWGLVKELGVTWIKVGCDVLTEPRDVFLRQVEACREHDLQVVVDFRIDTAEQTSLSWGKIYAHREEARRRLDALDPARAERLAEQGGETALARRIRLAHDEAIEVFCEEARVIVEMSRGLLSDWEVQGEWMCPSVITGSLASFDYQFQLVKFYEAIKQADPQARVWTGGSGVWVQAQWLDSLLRQRQAEDGARYPQGAGQAFDVCNWHHYGHTLNEQESPEITLEQQIAGYDAVFGEATTLLAQVGKQQPFASTEWGFPMYGENTRQFSTLVSTVYAGGVRSLHEDAAPEWYEASLECMKRWNFRVVCVHELCEHWETARSAYFWGGFCGLIDYEGRKRPVFDTVQKWAWAARDSGEAAF